MQLVLEEPQTALEKTIAQFNETHADLMKTMKAEKGNVVPHVAIDNVTEVLTGVIGLAEVANQFVPMLDGEETEYAMARCALDEAAFLVELASNSSLVTQDQRKKLFSTLKTVSKPVFLTHEEQHNGHADRKRRQYELNN